jgi:hypothetical protein
MKKSKIPIDHAQIDISENYKHFELVPLNLVPAYTILEELIIIPKLNIK